MNRWTQEKSTSLDNLREDFKDFEWELEKLEYEQESISKCVRKINLLDKMLVLHRQIKEEEKKLNYKFKKV